MASLIERRKAMANIAGPRYLYPSTEAYLVSVFGASGEIIYAEAERYAKQNPSIAPFINEDPMLVCSLGLSSVTARRYMRTDGSAVLYTGITPLSNTGVRTLVKTIQNQYNGGIFSAGTANDRYAVYDQNKYTYWFYPNAYGGTSVFFDNTPRILEYNIAGYFRIKDIIGNIIWVSDALNQIDCSGQLQTGFISPYASGRCDYAYLQVQTGSNIVANFVPFMRNNTMVWLDLVTLTIGNSTGTWTEVYEGL